MDTVWILVNTLAAVSFSSVKKGDGGQLYIQSQSMVNQGCNNLSVLIVTIIIFYEIDHRHLICSLKEICVISYGFILTKSDSRGWWSPSLKQRNKNKGSVLKEC